VFRPHLVCLTQSLVGVDVANLLSIYLLRRRVRDGIHLRAHRGGEHDPKMTQATNAHNANLLSGNNPLSLQRRVDRQARTQHGRSKLALETVGDLEREVFRGADVV